ncbi:MAG: 1,4-dihydroxy-6-naphthoate synthase [Bacteroidales bacterium]|nr:1,4-dihydroxy-6-naphthoate synthase [Bacteroidales bacterium]
MKLTLGFSPCPNDTFIFDALVNGRIDTEGFQFDYFLADVEELNRRAFTSRVDITKISCHAFAYASGDYMILDSGSALGYGNGPLLIGRKPMQNADVSSAVIAIPGRYTTANLLFSIAEPDARNKREYLFSEILNALLEGKADAGLIIHETRFTYAEKGLVKIADMGEFWEKLTGLPVPLGFIVINRRIPRDIALKFNRVLHRSIEYAREHSSQQQEFVTSNAREIEKSVISRHIDLYVNDFTLTLGTIGKKAVSELYRIATDKGVIPELPGSIFLI